MRQSHWLPLVIAWPMFLHNLDSTVLATALPSMAGALSVPVLHLNIAVTAYLLSLALCLPLSGWLADRWGSRRIFCIAIGLFTLGSLCCGLSRNLPELVGSRLLQGMGGAMMIPVARLILLRHIEPAQMIRAMVWFTLPGTVARLAGPLVGGVVVTVVSWRWIFLVQLPMGLIGLMLAWRRLPHDTEVHAGVPRAPFDSFGFVLLSLGLVALMAALEFGGKGLLAPSITALAIVLGGLMLWGYRNHSTRIAHPLIDLRVFQHLTYRTAVLGALPLRIAVGAAPFLLPLLMQVGFGLSPLESGLITLAGAIGSLSSRTVVSSMLRRFGFRTMLMTATVASSACYVGYGLFQTGTPHALMFTTMMVGGLFNATAMVALNSLGFSDIPREQAGHASTAATMVNQLSMTFGVVVGTTLLALVSRWNNGSGAAPVAADFSWVFFCIGGVTLLCLLGFRRLRNEHGADLHGD
jgi:EmrB/QacA subfamily drug resistance transporter